MGNRSPRHLSPGDVNLRGKRSKTVCPCCDPVMDFRDKARAKAHQRDIDDHLAEPHHRHDDTYDARARNAPGTTFSFTIHAQRKAQP